MPPRRKTVPLLTLAELWKKKTISHPDFGRRDVEGGELEVLQGALQLMRSLHPGWLVEVSRGTGDEVFRLLKGLGYLPFVYVGKLVFTESYRDKEF